MDKQSKSSFLLVGAIAGGIGFVAFVAFSVVGNFTASPAAFLAILVALAAAIFLFSGFHGKPGQPADSLTPAQSGKLGDVTRPMGSAGVEPGSAGVKPGSAPTAVRDVTGTLPGQRDNGDPTTNVAGSAPSAATAGMPDTTAAPATEAGTGLAGAPDDQGFKGGALGGDTGLGSDPSDAVDITTKDTEAPVPQTGEADHDGKAGDEASDQKWSSTQLAGEAELSERKGSWKYEGDSAPDGADIPGDGPDPTVGTEPHRLDSPREGGPDDLKEIKGVGPKLEEMLHGMGIYHFDQIAGWGADELAWVDEHLEGFKGRASRDNWVEQAQSLTSGA